jgi:hypothetical protein
MSRVDPNGSEEARLEADRGADRGCRHRGGTSWAARGARPGGVQGWAATAVMVPARGTATPAAGSDPKKAASPKANTPPSAPANQ